jgi:hypothetical protein
VAPMATVGTTTTRAVSAARAAVTRASEPGSAAGEGDVGAGEEREQGRRGGADQADEDLEDAVDHERARGAGGVLPADVGAEGEAAHEGGEHGAHGVGGRAEDVSEELGEGDLVEEAGGPRDEEEGRDQRKPAIHGAHRSAALRKSHGDFWVRGPAREGREGRAGRSPRPGRRDGMFLLFPDRAG